MGCPYLLVGWLWYLVMLLPAIGLVQFGAQAVADRFTYLPQIGLGIALAWWAADLCGVPAREPVVGGDSRRRLCDEGPANRRQESPPTFRRWTCGMAAALAMAVLAAVAWPPDLVLARQ